MNDNTRSLCFVVNDQEVVIDSIPPTLTLLAWLRSRGLVGSKEGCAEGDCGACTVLLADFAPGQALRVMTINACICLLPTLHGKAIYTVESLRRPDGSLHPVQQAMVDHHGSQCGFCTPGIVMSLFGVYLGADGRVSDNDLASALAGNLCRCTGYRPILAAGRAMFDQPRVAFDREGLSERLRELSARLAGRSLSLSHPEGRFDAPTSLAELCALRAAHPGATILAGGTDVGLWVTKQLRHLPHVIYLGQVAELHRLTVADAEFCIGAAVNLDDAFAALTATWPPLTELWQRFASLPIRHMGTLGGNIANGSPIGDAMPALIALGAEVELTRLDEHGLMQRRLDLADFYLAYQQKAWRSDEIVSALYVPLPTRAQQFRCYKLSKRYDSDISAVCAAFAIERDGNTVSRCRIAYGGMAATPKRARAAESALVGAVWDEPTVQQAMVALSSDYQPLSDLRASSGYRLLAAQNLLYRFYLETRCHDPLDVAQVSVFAGR